MINSKGIPYRYLEKDRLRLLFLKHDLKNVENSKNQIKNIYRNNPLKPNYTTTSRISNSISGSKKINEDFLLKKYNYLSKINRELKNQIKNISKKSDILSKDLSENKSQYLRIKQDYENELKLNQNLNSKLKNVLVECKKAKEINEMKEEQNILLITLKSKEKIINNLRNTLNMITKENEEEKKFNEIILKERNNQILELNKILNQLNTKFEENKKNIEEKEKIKNENKISGNYLDDKKNNIITNDENKENLNINPNPEIKNIKNNISIKKEEKQIIQNKNNKNNNLFNNQHLLTISEKPDTNSESVENNILRISYIDTHRRTRSNELNLKKYNEEIEYKIYNYTEGNIIRNKYKNTETNEINKDSLYLYTITKEGKLIEFDLIEKKYKKLKTNQIKDWNIFISEYSSFFEGSLLLNTFQGLFILTGKNYKDLYYYSKKYNSISKINTFNYGHKFGALILTPNSESIIALGGETIKVEILNIETGQIQLLPDLITNRINSAYSFVDDKLFSFFGKNNYRIEFLDIANSKKWELFNLIKNENNDLMNKEGLAAIPIINNEILFVGNFYDNSKMLKFNYKKRKIEYVDINIQSKNERNKYIFDKDKYFNNFINFEKIGKDGNYLNQLVGIDSFGNIHYFNNDFSYSIFYYEGK